jgi:hypothetical protein
MCFSELGNTRMKHVPSSLDGGDHCQGEGKYRLPHLSHVHIFPFRIQLWNFSDETVCLSFTVGLLISRFLFLLSGRVHCTVKHHEIRHDT